MSCPDEIRSLSVALTTPNGERKHIVTDLLFSRLGTREAERIFEKLRKSSTASKHSKVYQHPEDSAHFRRHILNNGSAFMSPETLHRIGITTANPPPDVHSMVRVDRYVGDLYNCDMITEALALSGIRIRQKHRYLDFGCSSGRIVRNMFAAFPAALWYGCDPQQTAISWAKENLPSGISFFTSPLIPPLEGISDGYFDGVFAISIWSHFSEAAALRWFKEMHRCISPGGWLLFTAHGANTLRHYAEKNLRSEDTIQTLLNSLRRNDFAYEDAFGEKGDWGVPSTDWGVAYFLPNWIASNLIGKGWMLSRFDVGRNSLNQDLYVLTRQ